MQKLVAAIKSIFANEVAIHVSREWVTVAWDGQSISIRPVVHLAMHPERQRILAVGDERVPAEPSRPLPVFGPLPADVSLETWVEGLHAFMDYALRQARVRMAIIRPTVHLRGVHALGQLPSGEPSQVLTNAVLRAHAFHCTVEN